MQNCKNILNTNKILTIDEGNVAFKGRSKHKIIELKKLVNGEAWTLAESQTGYFLKFHLLKGAGCIKY